MKILHVGKFYYPIKGGMETVIRSLVRGLATDKHQISVLCFNNTNEDEYFIDNEVFVYKASILGILFSQPLSLSFIFLFFKLVAKNDVIHLHTPNPLATLLCLFLPKDKKIILTHHSDIYRQKKLKVFFNPIYKIILKKADKIIVPTENHIKYSNEILNFKKKCEIIPFSLDSNFRLKNSNVDHFLGNISKDHSNPYLLFVGRLVTYKGLKYLLEAMSFAPDCELIIIGKGPLSQELKDSIKEKGLEGRVHLKGPIESQEELMAYYKLCEAVVLPSISPNENFGMTQLEAMAFKKPVITTNLKSGVPCVGIDGETCLIVEPESATELSKAIKTLMGNKELRQTMGEKGLERFSRLYTEEAAISSHSKLYKNL